MPKTKKKPEEFTKPTSVKGQKGEFVGVPAGIHIHLVKNKTHVQVGRNRHNFDEGDEQSVKGALDWFKEESAKGKPGYASVLAWLEKNSK